MRSNTFTKYFLFWLFTGIVGGQLLYKRSFKRFAGYITFLLVGVFLAGVRYREDMSEFFSRDVTEMTSTLEIYLPYFFQENRVLGLWILGIVLFLLKDLYYAWMGFLGPNDRFKKVKPENSTMFPIGEGAMTPAGEHLSEMRKAENRDKYDREREADEYRF